jgi:hypothetical protein
MSPHPGTPGEWASLENQTEVRVLALVQRAIVKLELPEVHDQFEFYRRITKLLLAAYPNQWEQLFPDIFLDTLPYWFGQWWMDTVHPRPPYRSLDSLREEHIIVLEGLKQLLIEKLLHG